MFKIKKLHGMSIEEIREYDKALNKACAAIWPQVVNDEIVPELQVLLLEHRKIGDALRAFRFAWHGKKHIHVFSEPVEGCYEKRCLSNTGVPATGAGGYRVRDGEHIYAIETWDFHGTRLY